MARRFLMLIFVSGLGLLVSCEQARQYKEIDKKGAAKADQKVDADSDLHRLSWIKPEEKNDLPLVFVPDTKPEWKQLPAGWNPYPPLPVHLGLSPMQGLAAVVLSEHHRVIKIKVPRGLPDPTPNIPRSNPPTYGKWRLGKELFYTPFVKVGSTSYSCNSCHEALRSFTSDPAKTTGARYNTLSLINVVYNRRQFWDGRVQTLEETLFQSADDERHASEQDRLDRGLKHHVWAGFARAIRAEGRLDNQFHEVFGIEQPTQDAAARALATYLRTLLSGDSLYDQAEQVRREAKEPTLKAAHFAAVVKDDTTAGPLRDTPGSDKPKREEMPDLLIKGHELFHGKARCSQCHTGPLFTDHDFHNIGCDKVENWPVGGKETGRAVQVPIGLKEARLIGAFRTSSLRNLIGTNAYFHDGSARSLREVVDFYDRGVLPRSPFLAKALKDGDQSQTLLLTAVEKEALVLFLRSLQGQPVDRIMKAP